MPIVIMMCGVCGAGKTTYAKQKEAEGFIRLSIDEEMWNIHGRFGIDYLEGDYDRLSEEIEKKLFAKLIKHIRNHDNVVIDFSFWNKEKRDEYTQLIESMSARRELVYLKADKEVLRKRLAERNKVQHANSAYVITDDILDMYYAGFQEPCGEGEIVILQN